MKSFGENVYMPEFYEMYRDIIFSSGGVYEQDYKNFIIVSDAILNFDFSDRIREYLKEVK